MGNCLVTKLKGVVDNPNLRKLGVVTIDTLSETNSYYQIQVKAGGEVNCTLLTGSCSRANGNVVIEDSTHIKVNDTEVQYPGFYTSENQQQVKLEVSNYYDLVTIPYFLSTKDVELLLKYSRLRHLSFYGGDFDVAYNISDLNLEDIEETTLETFGFKYCDGKITGCLTDVIKKSPGLRIVEMAGAVGPNTTAKASDFKGKVNLETVKLDVIYCFLENDRDISNFGDSPNLIEIRLQGTNINGTIESFVAAQIAAGRTTYSGLKIGANMGQATLGGVTIQGSQPKLLSWTGPNTSDITLTDE